MPSIIQTDFQNPIITTKVWYLQVNYTDGSTYLFHLDDIKESNTVEVDEYVESPGIGNKLAFRWWIKKVMKCRDQIIKKVKYVCCKPNQIMF